MRLSNKIETYCLKLHQRPLEIGRMFGLFNVNFRNLSMSEISTLFCLNVFEFV